MIAYHATQYRGEFNEHNISMTDWVPYIIMQFEAQATSRVVVFRPHPPDERFGSVRVYKPGSQEVSWDKYQRPGAYVGRVPAGYIFQVIAVQLKIGDIRA